MVHDLVIEWGAQRVYTFPIAICHKSISLKVVSGQIGRSLISERAYDRE